MRTSRPSAAAVVGVACGVLLTGCGGSTAPAPADEALVPAAVVARYLDREPLPPFDPERGIAELVACDAEVRPVWRTVLDGHEAMAAVRAAWDGLAEEDGAVRVSSPVEFRDGRVHVGLTDGDVRAAATTDRWDAAEVVVEVRLPCRDRRATDPPPITPLDLAPREPPAPAFPPEPPQPLEVTPDTAAATATTATTTTP